MKTLKLGSIALLLLCGFFSCKKESLTNDQIDGGYADLSATSEMSASATMTGNSTMTDCLDCVENFTSESNTATTNVSLKFSGTRTLTNEGNQTIKVVATTVETFSVQDVNVTVSHDAENVYYTFERGADKKFGSFRFISPATQQVNFNGDGNIGINGQATKVQVVQSRTSLPACETISFAFGIRPNGPQSEVLSPIYTYKLRDLCSKTACTIETGEYRTYSRGYWRNKDGQAFLIANTSSDPNTSVLPITIGVGPIREFENAGDVKQYLEEGIANGTPGTIEIPGTFGAQVLALAFNIKADNLLPSYSKAERKLATLKVDIDVDDIAAHPSWEKLTKWNGMSVMAIFEEAQNVLCGSTSNSPSHMNEIVTAINENFEDGLVNNGLLTCK